MRFGVKGKDTTKIHFNKYVNQLINHPSREGASGTQAAWLRERSWSECGVQPSGGCSVGTEPGGYEHIWSWGPGLASHLPTPPKWAPPCRVLPQQLQPGKGTEPHQGTDKISSRAATEKPAFWLKRPPPPVFSPLMLFPRELRDWKVPARFMLVSWTRLED